MTVTSHEMMWNNLKRTCNNLEIETLVEGVPRICVFYISKNVNFLLFYKSRKNKCIKTINCVNEHEKSKFLQTFAPQSTKLP